MVPLQCLTLSYIADGVIDSVWCLFRLLCCVATVSKLWHFKQCVVTLLLLQLETGGSAVLLMLVLTSCGSSDSVFMDCCRIL